MSQSENNLLTTIQAAERLGLHSDTLRRWRTEGIGPGFVRLRRQIRYEPKQL